MSQASKAPKKKRGIGRITIPIICVLAVIAIVLNVAANSTLSGILDAYIGRGEMKIETKAGAENWDTTYYDQDSTTAEDADRVAKDVTLRTAPVSVDTAREMIREIKGYPILKGLRGQAGIDFDAMAEMISEFSKLPFRYPTLKEADLNPVFASPEGVIDGDVRLIF